MTRASAPKMPTWAPEPNPYPVGSTSWFHWFDVCAFMTSGGKDSQEAEREALAQLRAAGVMGKVAGLHIWLDRRHDLADLDASDRARIEWQQVPQLAAEQARRNGVPLGGGDGWAVWDARRARSPISRDDWAGQLHFARRYNRDGSDFDGDLLDDILGRRKRTDEDRRLRRPASGERRGWPTMWTRYCTSDWKSAVGRAFLEFLCLQVRRELGLVRPARVLQILGFRAEESDERADRESVSFNYGASAQRSRHVWDWLPIHGRTWHQVWAGIQTSGVPYHPVYDEGMSRLSCRACIMGSRSDLSTARRLSPATFKDYESAEASMNDPFQHHKPLAALAAAPGEQGFAVRWDTCPVCSMPTLARAGGARRACPRHAAGGAWMLPGPRRAGRACVVARAADV